MESSIDIKTKPFLKYYKRKTDDHRQVIIRAKVFKLENGKRVLLITSDIRALKENGELLRATISEFNNRNNIEYLRHRINEIELLVKRAIQKIFWKNIELNVKNIFCFTYNFKSDFDNSPFEKIENDQIKKVFGHPVPIEVWDEIVNTDFTDSDTGAKLTYDEVVEVSKMIEDDFYITQRKNEIETWNFNLRYEKREFDKTNIFDCFGFCWSNDPKKKQPFIPSSYRALLIRLYDYRYNVNPPELIEYFNREWIDSFLIYLVSEGYADFHIKNSDPFKLQQYRSQFINAKRQSYKFSSFQKVVKLLKRYIFILQKNKIISNSIDTKFIEVKDYLKRDVSTNAYTRREHSLFPDEFELLYKTDYKDSTLNTARDMFVIAVLGGGFRGEEFYNEKLSVTQENGRYILNIYRSKTQTPQKNPCFSELERLLIRNNGKLPDFLSESKFRKALKKIAESLNFDRIIESPNTYINAKGGTINFVLKDIFSIYFARKTFVNYMVSKGMSEENIMGFTAHSKNETLNYYKDTLSITQKVKLLEKINLDS